jgi:hypothetical protein
MGGLVCNEITQAVALAISHSVVCHVSMHSSIFANMEIRLAAVAVAAFRFASFHLPYLSVSR